MRPTIDTRLQLAAIVLAEELHYGRAAQRLHIAVSTLSKQIAQLEEILGMILFLRDSKHVELTDAGRAYIEEVRASLLHAEKAVNVARAANEGIEHILAAGHTPYIDPNLVLTLLSIRLPLYPHIRVRLHSDFALDLVHGLLAAEIDLAIVAWPPTSARLTLVEITKSALYVVLPDHHPASRHEQVSLSDLANDDWILFNKRAHPLLYDAILRRADLSRVKPREIHHIVTPDEALHLVSEHAGISFFAKPVALNNSRPGTVVRPLAEESLQITTYLALRADESSRLVNEFARAFLRKCLPLEPPSRERHSPD